MTDLTEQWKKGELEKCKDYYVKYGDYEMSLTLDGDNDFIFYGRPIKPKVLAPVPSYDEWNDLREYVDYCIHNRDELTKQIIFWMDKNTELKELLKEWVQFEIEENPNDFTVMSERMSQLANKTKEALK